MGKNSKLSYPHSIETDQGETIVKLVPSSAASKIHKCLFCEHETDFYEQHVLLLPRVFPGNRRYSHTRCYERARRLQINIQLHPYAPNLTLGEPL